MLHSKCLLCKNSFNRSPHPEFGTDCSSLKCNTFSLELEICFVIQSSNYSVGYQSRRCYDLQIFTILCGKYLLIWAKDREPLSLFTECKPDCVLPFIFINTIQQYSNVCAESQSQTQKTHRANGLLRLVTFKYKDLFQ